MPILIKGSGGKEANLQSKSITPTGSGKYYYPDDGYDAFSSFTVGKRAASYVPTGGNASVSEVRSGKKFYSGGTLKTGTMADVSMPNPSIIKSFNTDKTILNVSSSFVPPVGYITSSSVGTHSLSTSVDVPVPDELQNECMFEISSPTSSDIRSETYYDYEIEWLDESGSDYSAAYGKTLKYVIISGSYGVNGGYGGGSEKQIAASIFFDAVNKKATIVGFCGTASYNGKFKTTTYSSIETFGEKDVYYRELSDGTRDLWFRNMCVCSSYMITKIYQ